MQNNTYEIKIVSFANISTNEDGQFETPIQCKAGDMKVVFTIKPDISNLVDEITMELIHESTFESAEKKFVKIWQNPSFKRQKTHYEAKGLFTGIKEVCKSPVTCCEWKISIRNTLCNVKPPEIYIGGRTSVSPMSCYTEDDICRGKHYYFHLEPG